MGKQSNIAWTGSTWNPWHGCTKVSAGCKFCYMYRDKERFGQDPTVVMRAKKSFDAPLHWKQGKRVFTCSWSDWFHQDADPWRADAWEIIKRTPQHTYQILTKRPDRIKENLPADWEYGYPNVWLGVSAEDQATYDERMPVLLQVRAPVRFVSLEPLLGPINLGLPGTCPQSWGFSGYRSIYSLLHWVTVGGESGNEDGPYGYRPCQTKWLRSIKNQCDQTDTPLFVKQMGTYLARELNLVSRHGTDASEFPTDLRLQQFPAE